MHKLTAYMRWKLTTQKGQLMPLIQTLFIFFLLLLILGLPLSQPALAPFYQHLSPFILFSAAFFVSCLPLSSYMEEDVYDGTLEQIVINGSIYYYCLSLYAVYLITYICPLLICLMGAAVIGQLSGDILCALGGSFFLSSLILLGWGSLSALLGGGRSSHNALFTIIIVLPLGVPSLLLSQATIQAAADGLPFEGYLIIHLGLTLVTMGISLGLGPTVLQQAV